MGYASFSNSAHFKGDPDVIWDAFTNPAVAGSYAEHRTELVAGPDYALEAGKSWQERHGAECDFDVVTWTITAHKPGNQFEFQGKQSGILQRVRMSMEPADGGWTLVEDIRFLSTVAGKFGTSVVAWAMWATGLLPKFSDDKGESFELLLEHLDGKPGQGTESADAGLVATMAAHAAGFVGAAAYVFEVARGEFGGRYVRDEGGDAFVLVVGEPSCSVSVMALGKVMKRVQHGEAESIEFLHAGIAPLVERGQSAVLR